MEVTINGQARTVDDGNTVLELLTSLDLAPEGVIVEHNGHILKPPQFNVAKLHTGDRVELIQFVGGG